MASIPRLTSLSQKLYTLNRPMTSATIRLHSARIEK